MQTAGTPRTTKAGTTRTNLFIDPDLWRALRVRAIEDGTTATDLLNHIIAAYLAAPRPKSKPAKKGA